MRHPQATALAVFTFALLGVAFALESHVMEQHPEAAEGGRPTDEAAFRRGLAFRLPAGARTVRESFDVPPGRRLVLELAVARGSGTGLAARLLTQGSGEDILEHRLAPSPVPGRPGTWEDVRPLRAFADAGSRVTLVVDRAAGLAAAAGEVVVFGYYLDVP